MRHRKSGRQLGRNSGHRKALYRNLVTALLEHERIETTVAKAKEIRKIAEKLVTLGKRGDLHARRQVAGYVRDPAVVRSLFERIAPRVANRPGGYFRILRLGVRYGDAAPRAIIELVDREVPEEKQAASAQKASQSKDKKVSGEA